MTTQTKPKLDESGLDNWPPVAHIAKKPITEKSRAICGAKLMGIELPNATKVCKKCEEIAKGQQQ